MNNNNNIVHLWFITYWLLACSSENVENQISIVEQGGVQVLASLARTLNDEVIILIIALIDDCEW